MSESTGRVKIQAAGARGYGKTVSDAMIETTYKGWRVLFNGDESLYGLMDDIINHRLQGHVSAELKNNQRSRVYLISFQGQKAVLKQPREKNTRKWIRFTTLYRRGEAFKAIQNLERLRGFGLEANQPFMAIEKRRMGMVVDSWLLYEFKAGKACDRTHYPSIVGQLKALHDRNLLHGDAHLENFLMTDKGIITIDANLKRPIFGAASKYYELLYLRHSAPGIEKYFRIPPNSPSYRLARIYSKIYWSWRASKKRRRQKRNRNLRILIIRLSSIGDIILTTPVLQALKSEYPDAEIHFLVMDTYQDAISGSAEIDRLIVFPKEKYRGFRGIYRFSRSLAGTRYDLIVDLHAKIRSRLISLFVGGRVLRYKKRRLWKSILVPLGLTRYHVDDTIVASYFKPLEKIRVFPSEEPLTFHFSPADLERVLPYRDAVVMAPGAANRTKQWPAENFAALGGLLKEPVLLIGGKQDRETCRQISERIGGSCTNLAGRLSLKESGALISLSKFVVSNDSAAFHMARSTGQKVFVIFGPTDPGMFTYDDKAVLIYAGTPCSPCSLHGDRVCPQGHFDCMHLLTPEIVYRAIQRATGQLPPAEPVAYEGS